MSNRQFRKKPIVINAFQFHVDTIPDWFTYAVSTNKVILHENKTCTIKTLEGDYTGLEKEYIIQGIQGELYLCKEDIFKSTYEEV